jgi:hypothetical protein
MNKISSLPSSPKERQETPLRMLIIYDPRHGSQNPKLSIRLYAVSELFQRRLFNDDEGTDVTVTIKSPWSVAVVRMIYLLCNYAVSRSIGSSHLSWRITPKFAKQRAGTAKNPSRIVSVLLSGESACVRSQCGSQCGSQCSHCLSTLKNFDSR